LDYESESGDKLLTAVETEANNEPAVADKSVYKQALTGMVRAVPIMLGYLPIGFAFGVLTSTAGLSMTNAVAISLFVYAGSAQLISVGMIAAGAGVAAITMTVFLVNLRHMLMSAYLAPYLGKLQRWQQALFSYELTDESFAVHSVYFRQYGVSPPAELFALNHSAHLAWIGGTMLGAWVGGHLALDTTTFGIDYALPAMFIALLVMQIDNWRRAAIAALAAAIGLSLYLIGMSQLYTILATVIAATVGAALKHDPESERNKTSAGKSDTEGGL
jgi:4-azaleucine resistance transporter AzlC